MKKNKSLFIYTDNESWFFYNDYIRKIRMTENEKEPIYPHHDMNARKIMIDLFWIKNLL